MSGTDDFDLYSDLYGDAEPAATTAAAASTSAPAPAATPAVSTQAPAAAVTADPRQAPTSTATPPTFGLPPNPTTGGTAGQPAPLHFDSSYQNNRPAGNVRPSDMPDEGKMFIGGLNWDTTDDTLKSYFEQFGKVTHCTIMRDQETHRSRGFAFLTFEDPASVNAVMQRDHYLDGKTIDPKRAIPRSEAAKTDKLFVRQIPPSATPESFRTFWRQFGAITDATLMMDKESGRHRGFGFVNYEDSKSVERVLTTGPHMMDGQMLEVKRAQTKGENQRQNQGGNNFNQAYHPSNNNNSYNNQPQNQGAPNAGGFDAQAMAKFFQQMGWGGAPGGPPGGAGGPQGGFNPFMMMQGMGGMGMPGFGMMPGMGMPGMPGMGMPGMGMPGMGMGMPGMDGGFYGGAGAGPSGSQGAGGEGYDAQVAGSASPQGGASGQQSQWTAPMSQQSMRGGRGGGHAVRGGRPPSGPASMRSGSPETGGSGAGPQRTRGGGAGYHPYSR